MWRRAMTCANRYIRKPVDLQFVLQLGLYWLVLIVPMN
jgi:hypothetical protein